MSGIPDDGGAATGPPVEELSYTEASRELDDIVHFFEQRDVDVDQLVGRLVRATALVEELDNRLRQTRMQVEQLVPRLAAVLSDAPQAGAPRAGVSQPPQAPHVATTGGASDEEEDLGDLDEADLEEVQLAEPDPFGGEDDFSDDDEGDVGDGSDVERDVSGMADDGTTPELF